MRVSDFDYSLPEGLIANYPTPERTASRLLTVNPLTGDVRDGQFTDIKALLSPGDLLVFNNTRVIPARLYGHKSTGGKIEILVERVLDSQRVLVHLKSSKSPKPGAELLFSDGLTATVEGRQGELFELVFSAQKTVLDWLDALGHMPLPPYIQREDESIDHERYQTVYAKAPGAVAAPTAGLHFDEALMSDLANQGVHCAFLTLHVGAGTFQPVRVENVDEHHMHSEFAVVSEALCEQVRQTKAAGHKVIAVGTTSVRALESAAQQVGTLQPFVGDTDIFIKPGFSFQVVDAMITNFHLPKSTLLMLVGAFAGHALMMRAYAHAVSAEYRFYSYGDAMLIGDF